ncbi:MAG TPA: hypothetical protein PKO16_04790 [Bacteroidia bacterium]|nr:hypothetical protein [Bacteroidia bacterium]
MKENDTITIALDGHDGSGKTTISKLVASTLKGIYVRPFAGSKGIALIEAADQEDYDLVLQIGNESIQDIYNQHSNDLLIFDRHWMTVLSLVPENFWNKWLFFPPTILCWANLAITKQRLDERSEKKFDDAYHKNYLTIYKKLANQYGALIIDTSNKNTEQCLAEISKWTYLKKIHV